MPRTRLAILLTATILATAAAALASDGARDTDPVILWDLDTGG